MKVYILPNPGKPDAMKLLAQAGALLRADGIEVILSQSTAARARLPWQATVLTEDEACGACDIMLTIGGDGTMLHAARRALTAQKPLLGINIGRLGFLTLIESNELEKLHRLAAGDYAIEHRSVICATPKGGQPTYALNDIVLFKELPERSISLNIYCDDILVSSFRGDGIIFATPTGSTAYSLSAGGPILDTQLGGIVVTQICAHIVHTPPLVFAGSRTLRAVVTGLEEEKLIISTDGARGECLGYGGEVHLTQSDKTVPMVKFNDAQQLEFIDKKLKGR